MPSAHGFIVEGQTVQYDYNYLANKPEPELPERSSGDEGKVLTVTDGQGTVGWEEIPEGLPGRNSGDTGKVLAIKDGQGTVGWEDVPEGLPSRNTGDAGKVLTVTDGQGTVGWEEISAGMDAAVYDPTSVVASAGGIVSYVAAHAQGSLTFDNAPTQNSSNPVTSDGVYTAIQALLQQISALASRVSALEQSGEQESGGASVENNMLSLSGASVNDNILALDGTGAEVDDHMINF